MKNNHANLVKYRTKDQGWGQFRFGKLNFLGNSNYGKCQLNWLPIPSVFGNELEFPQIKLESELLSMELDSKLPSTDLKSNTKSLINSTQNVAEQAKIQL